MLCQSLMLFIAHEIIPSKREKSECSQADLIDVVSQELFSSPHSLFLKDGLFLDLKPQVFGHSGLPT